MDTQQGDRHNKDMKRDSAQTTPNKSPGRHTVAYHDHHVPPFASNSTRFERDDNLPESSNRERSTMLPAARRTSVKAGVPAYVSRAMKSSKTHQTPSKT